jgi:hypothetical protein
MAGRARAPDSGAGRRDWSHRTATPTRRLAVSPAGRWMRSTHAVPPGVPGEAAEPEGNRDLKHRLVEKGKAHAALVFDGDVAVGWCE